jgi:hypothetical protein
MTAASSDKHVTRASHALLGGRARRDVDPRGIQERLVFCFLNESALCLEEGISALAARRRRGRHLRLGFRPSWRVSSAT